MHAQVVLHLLKGLNFHLEAIQAEVAVGTCQNQVLTPQQPPPPKKKNCLKVEEEASLWGVKFHFKASLTGSEVPTAPLKSDLQWIV